ncbi:MAG: glycosyltransferase [Elusimicrobia bacterium]|nr:glycosyltransferase [Elusimicrobiota bacterium]
MILIKALSAASFAASAGLWACLAASARHFQGAPDEPCRLPMTLIKPVKGLDDEMAASFESIVAADPLNTLQVIVAMESAEDPAFAVAGTFRDAHPGRDISVVVTGPAGARMGKAHNMIVALDSAKHRFVLFSDADTRMSAPLLADAARAFSAGADAVYAMPYHAQAVDSGGWWFMIAFNHAFCVPVALSYRVGQLRSFAGAFMGYTREALARAGGLDVVAHAIADDLSLGLAARSAGARQELLRVPVRVSETGTAPREVFAHLAKWASIVCWTYPAVWLIAPLFNPTLLAAAALAAAGLRSRGLALPGAALAAALASRVVVAWLQDRRLAGYRLGVWAYWRLLVADLGALLFYVLGLRSEVEWRGRRYRLFLGGRCEVVAVGEGATKL